MVRGPRIVAELGRPETQEETAARKAEASRVYRSSQTFRNLIAALLATLAIVAVIALGVPRGEPAPAAPIDVAQTAADLSATYGRALLVPAVPASWRVNGAAVSGSAVPQWTIVYATDDDAFIRVTQALGAPADWPLSVLGGKRASETTTIDGITWSRWRISDPNSAGNIAYALGTRAGTDEVLLAGNADEKTTDALASGLSDQLRALGVPTP